MTVIFFFGWMEFFLKYTAQDIKREIEYKCWGTAL
jgi:hypothetical protein